MSPIGIRAATCGIPWIFVRCCDEVVVVAVPVVVVELVVVVVVPSRSDGICTAIEVVLLVVEIILSRSNQ